MLQDSTMNRYLLYKDTLEKMKNLFLLGRLAEYKYFDMDDSVSNSLEKFRVFDRG